MKFDPEAMRALLTLDDPALWAKIREIAGASGIQLPAGTPSAQDMARIRTAMSGCGQADVVGALKTLARLRREG